MINLYLHQHSGAVLASSLLVSALSIMPIAAMAEVSGSWTYSVSENQATITSYTGSTNGTVIIPESLDSYPVVAIGENVFSSYYITTVIIPATVTSIGDGAFYGGEIFQNLVLKGNTPPTLGSNVLNTSNPWLKVFVPESAVATYQSSWPQYASYIKADIAGKTFVSDENTYLMNEDYTATLVSCGSSNSNLTFYRAYYSGGDYQITAIADNAFVGNNNVKSVGIDSEIRTIGNNAFNSSSLEEVLLNFGVPSSVTVGDNAFPSNGNCKVYVDKGLVDSYKAAWPSYANIIYANPQGSTVTIGDYECFCNTYEANSASVTLKKYNGTSSSIEFPKYFSYNGKQYNVEKIESEAFANNSNIETVVFPNYYFYYYENPTKVFSGCSNLSKVYIKSSVSGLSINSDWFENCSNDLVIYVPSQLLSEYKTKFSEYTVKTDLTTLTISDDHFTYSLNDDMQSLSVTRITNASSLSELTIPEKVKFTLDEQEVEYPVTGINELEEDNWYVKTLVLPASISRIANNAFSHFYNLSTVNVLGTVPATLSGDIFYKYSISNILVPNGMLSVYKNAWPQYADKMQENIAGTTFTIGDFQYKADENQNLTIEKYTGSESTVLLPEKVEKDGASYPLTAIAANAFEGNTSLTFVSISASVTSIGDAAFKGCSALTQVAAPSTSTPATIGTTVFEGCADDLKIYVPYDCLGSYQSSWSEYSSKIVASAEGTRFNYGNLTYKILPDLHHVAIVARTGTSTDASGVFTIPEEVEYNDVTYGVSTIAAEALCYYACKELIVPASIVNVEDNAFNYCYFNTVKFLGTSTYVGGNAFYGCYNLQTVLVPNESYSYYKKNAEYSEISNKIAVQGDELLLTDEKGLQLDHPTYFEEGKLSYNRTFDDGAQYATLCLPFDFDASASGFEQVYSSMGMVIHFTPASTSTDSDEAGQKEKLILMLNKQQGGIVPAGTPVFVKLGTVRTATITNANAVTVGPSSVSPHGNMMTTVDWDGTSGLMEENTNFNINYGGTYENKDAGSIPDLYTFNPDGSFGPQTSGTLYPFRMYLTVYSHNIAMSSCSLSIGMGDGITTDIHELVTESTSPKKMSNAIYDLNGRIVSTTGSIQGLPKGVYIQNHKKVMVK